MKLISAVRNSKNKRLLKGMLTLAAGGVGAKLVAFLALPVITRLYDSSEFGELSIFSAVALIIAPLLSLRYVNAIAVPRTSLAALNLLVLSVILIFLFGVVLCFLMVLFGERIDSLFSFSISEYWWLLLLTVVGVGLYEAMTLWATRCRSYRVMAVTQFQQSSFGSLVKIVLGFLGFSTFGLLLGQWIQNSAGLISYLKTLGPGLAKGAKHVSPKRMIMCARKYSDFPRFRLPSHVLMLVGIHTPVLFFGYHYDPEITGQLALCIMVLSLPTQVIGTAMSHAFLGEISRNDSLYDGELKRYTVSVVKTMIVLSVVPAAILILFGEIIFKFVFGQSWAVAGVFSQILSLYLVAKFVSTPLMHVFTVLNKQEMFFRLNLVRFGLLLVVGAVAINLSLGPYVVLLMFSCAMTLHYIYTVYRVFRLIDE